MVVAFELCCDDVVELEVCSHELAGSTPVQDSWNEWMGIDFTYILPYACCKLKNRSQQWTVIVMQMVDRVRVQ